MISTHVGNYLPRARKLLLPLALFGFVACLGCGSSERRPPGAQQPQAPQIQHPIMAAAALPDPPGGANPNSPQPTPAQPPLAPLTTEREVRSLPPPADLTGDVELEWTSALGPGGMLVPQAPDTRDESEGGLTRLLAIVLPEDEPREVLFVGVREPNLEPLRPSELLDAFLLAYRAMAVGMPPGVSIDPKTEQLQAGLKAGDMMDVVYFGGVEQTDFGYAAFEADRLMKCLSAGIDNSTGQPFTCSVPGYRSELELHGELSKAGGGPEWHRFWIEHARSDIGQSADGRTLMGAVKLAINTQYMQVRNGELVSGDQPPDPAAKQFASHLTQHYAKYAEAFPVFNRLAVYAVLTSMAAAIHHDDASPYRRLLEDEWWLEEHPIATRQTPTGTKAVVASDGRVQMTGGVTLKPENQYYPNHPRTVALQQDALAARRQQPDQREWTVMSQGIEYQVVRARPRRARRMWQEDLRVGSLRLVREFGPRYAQGKATAGWQYRAPRVRLSEQTARYADAGEAPSSATIYDESGRAITLSKFGMLTMPGNAATPGYSNPEGTRSLYLYRNAWMYLEGQVDFVSINGGPPQMQLGADGRILRFSPNENEQHRILSVQTPQEQREYQYDGERLSVIRNKQGEAIRFPYDSAGRCTGAVGSDGQSISYVFDELGRLRYLTNANGDALSYLYDDVNEGPIGVRGRMQESPARDHQPVAQAVIQEPEAPPSESFYLDARTRYLTIEPLADGSGGYEILIDGKGIATPGQVRLGADFSSAVLDSLVGELLSSPAFQGADAVVVLGAWDLSNRLAASLRKMGAAAFSATSREVAERNLHGVPAANGKTQMAANPNDLHELVYEELPRDTGAADAGTVLVVGHNTAAFIERLHQMGEKGAFKDRDVVLLTCFSDQTPGAVENILRNYGAVSVTGFSQPVPQFLLPPLVQGLQTRLSEAASQPATDGAMRKHQSIESFIRGVADELLQQKQQNRLPAAIQEFEIHNLKNTYERLGRWRPLPPRAENGVVWGEDGYLAA